MGDNLYSCPAMLLRKHIVLLKGAAALTVQSTHNYTVVIFIFLGQSVAPGFHHDVFLCTFLGVSHLRKSDENAEKKFKGEKK